MNVTSPPPSHDTSTGENRDQRTLVWDLPLRVFHWAMVLCVAIAALTGLIEENSLLQAHIWAGYGLGFLLCFRLVWALVGGPNSGVKALNLKPAALKDHLVKLLSGKSDMAAGHNPAGSWMILLLISTMILLVLSGLITAGGSENIGPFKSFVGYRFAHFVKEIHEFLAFTLWGAAAIHIAAVLFETLWLGHPILQSMIDGKKPIDPAPGRASKPYAIRGILAFLAVLAIVIYASTALATLPGRGWHQVEVPSLYKAECGDCHMAYHPSLHSAENWQKIMENLGDHFGEDASLSPATAKEITDFLLANDAEHFDSKASNRIGLNPAKTLAFTETKFGKKRHDDIKSETFSKRPILAKSNCKACHSDAESGLYSALAIDIPKGEKK